MAKLLLMKKPKRTRKMMSEQQRVLLATSDNDLNSKSLLANVLDINDDFGVLNNKRPSFFRNQVCREQKINTPPEKKTFSNYSINKCLSQSPNISNHKYNRESSGPDLYEPIFIGSSKTEINLLRKNLSYILKEIQVITRKLKIDEEDELKSLNWKFAAMVIDRLCLIMFSLVTLVSTLLILFTSKNFFKSSDPDLIY